MKILLKNANLISMSNKRRKYEEGVDILICENKIKKIEKDIKCEENEKVIDATKKIVMPGLINTHSHVSMSIFRETIDGYDLQKWLQDEIWPMEDKMGPTDIYYASYLSAIEMAKNGCTTINDMYCMAEETIKVFLNIGLRLQTTRTLMNLANDIDKRIEELKQLIDNNDKSSLITFNAGIHGLYTTDEKALIKCLEFAKKEKLRIHMHFCENNKEVEDIKKEYKVNKPIEVIKKYMMDYPLILAHAVKLEDEEIKELGKHNNISIAHCPISNLKLGCGIAKIQEMIENNINVSIGTDGQGSGSNLDIFEEMKYCALLQKGINENPTLMPAYEVLKMATINGAKALGLEDEIGSIEEEKKADLIIININTEKIQPVNNIFSDIVYNANGSNVETTIVDGKIIMENRKMNCNENNVFEECEKIIKRLRKED